MRVISDHFVRNRSIYEWKQKYTAINYFDILEFLSLPMTSGLNVDTDT